jgi:hypothetical protein
VGWTFSPPVTGYGPSYRADADRVTKALWGHFRGAPEPKSVLKSGATYTDQGYVYSDDIDAADVFYQGGHVYPVTESEAGALTAAGYDVYLLDARFGGREPNTSMDGLDGFWHSTGIYDADVSAAGGGVLDASFTSYIDAQGRVRTPETTVAGAGSAGYSWGYLDAVPTRVGHEHIFASTSTARSGNPGVATVISAVQDDDSPVPVVAQSVHVVTVGYGVGVYFLDNDSPPFTPDGLHLFDEFLAADDVTPHVTEVAIDGDLITVTCPDGFELEVEDASASDLWGGTVLFEQLWGPGYVGAEPMSTRVWAVA